MRLNLNNERANNGFVGVFVDTKIKKYVIDVLSFYGNISQGSNIGFHCFFK